MQEILILSSPKAPVVTSYFFICYFRESIASVASRKEAVAGNTKMASAYKCFRKRCT